jgi:hypothetical protein
MGERDHPSQEQKEPSNQPDAGDMKSLHALHARHFPLQWRAPGTKRFLPADMYVALQYYWSVLRHWIKTKLLR